MSSVVGHTLFLCDERLTGPTIDLFATSGTIVLLCAVLSATPVGHQPRGLVETIKDTDVNCSWLTPKAVAHEAGLKGMGSFAAQPIAAGETVAGFGGYVVTSAGLRSLDDDQRSRSIQIDEDLYLAPNATPEPGDFVNHSCEPTCGLRGGILVVAMRDIEVGEEITFDYAMCDSSPYDEFVCECNASTCRRLITGGDWLDPVLQQKYEGWFSPYLAKRIEKLTVGS